MKQSNQITAFKFALSLFVTTFNVVTNLLFSETDSKHKEQEPLSHDQPNDPSLDWGDTHDDGWIE